MWNGVPMALALDLFQITGFGQGIFEKPFYEAVDALNRDIGAPIRWGGSFVSLRDLDHFELILKKPDLP